MPIEPEIFALIRGCRTGQPPIAEISSRLSEATFMNKVTMRACGHLVIARDHSMTAWRDALTRAPRPDRDRCSIVLKENSHG